MVLRRGVLIAALALACVPKPQPVKSRTPLTVAVAVVEDRTDKREVGAVPEEVTKKIVGALADRNLRPKLVPHEAIASAFASRRTTPHRLAHLAEGSDADLLALVETTATFYSQMNGRYRWVVQARVTMAKRNERDQAVVKELDFASFLDFDHQKEADALAAAAPRIGETVGRLADDFLGGLGVVRSAPKNADDAIYFVLVDRFANGDAKNDGAIDLEDPQGFHGGDLQGVLDRLDHLQALGVKTVWLSPVFKMRTEKFKEYGAFHGYWITDHDRVEPRFGDEALLKKLSDELHRRNMRLVLDVVLNHVAFDAPLVKEKPHWFHGKGAITDWNDRAQVETHDVFGLPDLAQENEEVYSFLLRHSLDWIARVQPDGYRLDAARHVPLPFWTRHNTDVLAKKPSFELLGELYDGDQAQLTRMLRDGHFTGVFDFPLYFAMTDVFCKDAPVSRLASTLFSDRAYDDPRRLVTFLDNHDLPRVASACGQGGPGGAPPGARTRGLDGTRVEQALGFLLTARGTPSLTYGTEVAMEGKSEPENRADMRFEPHPIGGSIAKWLAVRRAHPSLTSGVDRILHVDDDGLFAYARIGDEEAAIVAVNRGASVREVKLPPDLGATRAIDAYTGETLPRARFTVPAKSLRVAILDGKSDLFARAAQRASRGLAPVTRVTVRASGAPIAPGESLLMVGSGPELGSWNPANGVKLAPSKTGEWTATLDLPQSGAWEWKLVASGATPKWESGANRLLFVPERRESLAVAARWRAEHAAIALPNL